MKIAVLGNSEIAKIDFTENISRRKILEFRLCVHDDDVVLRTTLGILTEFFQSFPEAINQPIEVNTPNEEEEEVESLNESDELSMIGEDLVNQSLAEVTAILDQQMDLNEGEKQRPAGKRISFLVPTNIPRISLSSADEGSQISQ